MMLSSAFSMGDENNHQSREQKSKQEQLMDILNRYAKQFDEIEKKEKDENKINELFSKFIPKQEKAISEAEKTPKEPEDQTLYFNEITKIIEDFFKQNIEIKEVIKFKPEKINDTEAQNITRKIKHIILVRYAKEHIIAKAAKGLTWTDHIASAVSDGVEKTGQYVADGSMAVIGGVGALGSWGLNKVFKGWSWFSNCVQDGIGRRTGQKKK